MDLSYINFCYCYRGSANSLFVSSAMWEGSVMVYINCTRLCEHVVCVCMCKHYTSGILIAMDG